MDDLVTAIGMTGISKSRVSRLCEDIDAGVSVAVIIAVGIDNDGRREVLGMTIGTSEAQTFWTEFLRQLARRGLPGAELVISDAHEGSRPPSRRSSPRPLQGLLALSLSEIG